MEGRDEVDSEATTYRPTRMVVETYGNPSSLTLRSAGLSILFGL